MLFHLVYYDASYVRLITCADNLYYELWYAVRIVLHVLINSGIKVLLSLLLFTGLLFLYLLDDGFSTILPRGWTLEQPAKRAERSGVCPTNPLAFSLNLLYPEMSGISINELCFDPVKNLDSGVLLFQQTRKIHSSTIQTIILLDLV